MTPNSKGRPSMPPRSRPEQLADALILIAKADHTMVGLVEKVSAKELDEAKSILLARQKELEQRIAKYRTIEHGLDLLEESAPTSE